MNAADVHKRSSLSPSISADGKVLPVWLVPPTAPADLERAEFAVDVLLMFDRLMAQRLHPRGAVLRQYRCIDDMRDAIGDACRLMPAARLHVLIEPALEAEAVEFAKAAHATFQVLDATANWVDLLWKEVTALTGLTEQGVDGGNYQAFGVGLTTRATDEMAASVAADEQALQIAGFIEHRLCEALGIESSNSVEVKRFGINLAVIFRMIYGSFWSGSKSKLFLLNQNEDMNQFSANEAFKFLVRAFGDPVDTRAIVDMSSKAVARGPLTKDEEKVLRRKTSSVPADVILDHLKFCNQRDNVEWRTDMFLTDSRMRLLEDKVRVMLTHKPFAERGGYEPKIIGDYKQHFPRFDQFLQFLVQSRFALDRKKCYLWIFADSDWGKGFLLGVLRELGLAVETSMAEIETMLEGKPVGRTPLEFKRAFALVVDEFKTVKSELKQLQSEIALAPKHQLTSSVEVFAKVFFSAENVASLVTSYGVEDQFANRMSVFKETGSLIRRPLYVEVGNPRYFKSVVAYTADTMNRLVGTMQAKGRLESQTSAEKWINDFIQHNGLDTEHERFSNSLPSVADEVLQWLYKGNPNVQAVGCGQDSQYYLTSPMVVLSRYLDEHFDRVEVQAFRRKKNEILKLLSADGRGVCNHRINGRQTKAVLLKRLAAGGGDSAEVPVF